MSSTRSIVFIGLMLIGSLVQAESTRKVRIILVAGETAKVDKVGHHDYLAGCECLKVLLNQAADIDAIRVNDGWPKDETVFNGARSVVFYTDGGGKQAFLKSPQRIAKVQSLVDAGVGIVMIHQAVDYPDEFAAEATRWLGGIYRTGKSGRGHWPSEHKEFPDHPIARGVKSWKINDGWLNEIQFVAEKKGITPLVWSGKEYVESRAGIDNHIVSWAFDRPDGGRSFSFTGLDAHSAWELPGVRQLVVNGVMWSAGIDVPPIGAGCEINKTELDAMLTPRTPKKKVPAKSTKKTPVKPKQKTTAKPVRLGGSPRPPLDVRESSSVN